MNPYGVGHAAQYSAPPTPPPQWGHQSPVPQQHHQQQQQQFAPQMAHYPAYAQQQQPLQDHFAALPPQPNPGNDGLLTVRVGAGTPQPAAPTAPTSRRHGLTATSRGFVLMPPAAFGSWARTPANPALGQGGLKAEELEREDFRFYCDPCQKGFNSKRQFEAHQDDHIYCEYPGCKFTCRKGKEWKMELHVASLHNRPDAPDLQNTDAYLASRRRRFPTVELVKTKVDELYYRAAKGEVLPDERRRWLKQHGVFVSKKWFVPVMREGDEALDESRRRRADARKERITGEGTAKRDRAADGDEAAAPAAGAPSEPTQEQSAPEQPSAEGRAASAARSVAGSTAGGDAEASAEDLSKWARRPGQKMLPLGPNGRYTKAQLVQMVKERYDHATKVPDFYVCNRCGEKGHWVEACPKATDKVFDAEARWAVEKPPRAALKPAGEADGEVAAAPAAEEEDAPPEEASAAAPAGTPTDEELAQANNRDRRANGPALEARLAAAKERSARRAATADESAPQAARRRAPQHLHRVAPPPKAPSLWDKLTEDQRLNERGLLLQAIRFFVANDFFDAPAEGAGGKAGASAAGAGDGSEAAAPPRRKFNFQRAQPQPGADSEPATTTAADGSEAAHPGGDAPAAV